MKAKSVLLGVLAVVTASAAHASAPVSTLPVSFWGNDVTLERGKNWLDIVNRVFAANGVHVQFTVAGVGPSKSASDVFRIGGMYVLFVPAEQLPNGAVGTGCSNALPLFENSCFETEMASYLVDAAPDEYTALVMAHEFGHNLGLGHTPGTIMSANMEGHTNFNSQQVAILNEAGPQAATPPVRAALGGLLLNGRFTVRAEWKTLDGGEGSGKPVALTADSGYFWFFADTNIEVTAKVLNACALSIPRFWVFMAGMTNVEVKLTVTDVETDAQKIYVNNQGTAFLPIQDTNAFATCHSAGAFGRGQAQASSASESRTLSNRPTLDFDLRSGICGNLH